MINPKLLSDGELIGCLEEMRRRDADALLATSPLEMTEGPIREHLTQTMLAHLRHMARVRPAGLDRDAAEWAIGELERRDKRGHQAFKLAVHHQERADAAEAALTSGQREQPMRCRWCDKVHYGGPENCGKPDAEPAVALTAGDRK